jgi:hypothetical protein
LIEHLIQAILSIARNLPAAAAPAKPDATPFPPKQHQNTPVRPGPSKGHSPPWQEPARQESARQERPAPKAGEPPGSGRQTQARTLPPTAHPSPVRRRARPGGKRPGATAPRATAPPGRPPKNRAFRRPLSYALIVPYRERNRLQTGAFDGCLNAGADPLASQADVA